MPGARDEPVFVGRADERALIRTAAADAAAGTAVVVRIEGAAGVGKSALVERAVGELPGQFQVLRVDADEVARDTSFALLDALGVHGAGEAFAAGMALLRDWAARQDQGPVAVVVEDLHWADAGSRGALLTASRRLGADRVLVVTTTRPDGPPDGWARFAADPRRCRAVVLGALGVDDVADLARAHGTALAPAAAERLHRHTGGHALYVRTVLTEAPSQRLTGEDELPVPRSLASTIVARVTELPDGPRRLAQALAVVGRPVSLVVAGRVAGLDRPAAALDTLLTTGLLTWRPTDTEAAVGYAHPLYRLAVDADITPTTRRSLHRAAAGHLGAAEALAHRVASADGADGELEAALLEAAAGHTARRAHGRAARHLLWAASVAPTGSDAERHLLDGVWRWMCDGRFDRAEALRDRVESCGHGARRDLVLGALDWAAGRAGPAEAALRRAHADADPAIRREALARLASILTTQGRGAEAVAAGRALLAESGLDPAHERSAWIALALGEQQRHGAPAGLALLAERLGRPASEVHPDDLDLLVVRGTMRFFARRSDAAVDDLRTALRLGRRGAPPSDSLLLPRAHLQLSQLLTGVGDWDDARRHAELALALVDEDGRVWMRAQAHAALTRLAACRGEWAAAHHHAEVAAATAAELDTPEARFTTLIAAATLARARGEPARVVATFEPLLTGRHPIPMATSLGWWPMVVSALIDVGRRADARDHIERLRAAADARGLDLGARLAALDAHVATAEGRADEGIAGFRAAIADTDRSDHVLDRGEAHHRLGRLLLAHGRRRDGLAQLRRAREVLSGAAPFVARVEADLSGAGLRAPVGTERSALELTDRERDVVALVRQGRTNREVAEELYVSDKAVEYHLGNVYAKLGIRSRRELRAV